MVMCIATPPLRLEQWHEIGSVMIPHQQMQNHRATNGYICTSGSRGKF
jgi:hypothetical protein